jgi:hypothetical protein
VPSSRERWKAPSADDLVSPRVLCWRYALGVPRKPTDDDATGKLKPSDKTQTAPKGTKIGLLKRADVLADFRKIARKS